MVAGPKTADGHRPLDRQHADGRARTVSLEVAAKELGIGRTLAYELAKRNELPGMIRLGRRIVVSRAALEKMLSEREPSPAV